MSDITKCLGYDCPLRESCYRYTVKANQYQQSYFAIEPIDGEGDEMDCKEWIDNMVKL